VIIAMHIKSESGDSYVELFVNDTIEVVKSKLYEGMEWYCPVCEYQTAFSDDTTDEEIEQVKEMLSTWYDDSWKREDY
jgi:hypothetical protein